MKKSATFFFCLFIESFTYAQSVPQGNLSVRPEDEGGVNAALASKVDVTNTNANPVNIACPVGGCPSISSTIGPVKSAYSLQGETQINSGQGEMVLNLGLLVDKGASGGAVTYGKLPLYVGMMQTRGAGSAWAFSTNSIRNGIPGGENSINDMPGSGTPGLEGLIGSVSTIGYENDLTNWDEDTAISGAFVAGYYGHMQGSYASTAYLNLDAAMAAGAYGAHYGEYFQPNTVKDAVWVENTASTTGMLFMGSHKNADIEDDATGNVVLLIKGTKNIASILDEGNSPGFLQSSGKYTIATINDRSTSPSAFNLSGNYSLAAITDSTPNNDNEYFMIIKDKHKICFELKMVC
ncbi:hypothetical protein, partial [Gluconobacter japonicus]|uniref:hypothetical protein n=1 Tax=Gluconobacter japonicus TaxID=376620 RepID=UPI0039EA23E5